MRRPTTHALVCRGATALAAASAAGAPLALLLFLAAPPTARAQEAGAPARPRSGEAVYAAACASCHGDDGRGTAGTANGLEVAPPDFTDCSFVTREPDADWAAVVHVGGPARAFDPMMPSFGEALDRREIGLALDHIRRFCPRRAWPRGDLNFPRPLVTEKAFIEDELVVTTAVATGAAGQVASKLVYEQRFGARNQLEVILPFTVKEAEAGGWSAGLGDVALGAKRALVASLATGTILAVAGEVILPTGDESDGFGKGVTVLEPFLAFGQALPSRSFLHVQLGAEIPTDLDLAQEVFGRLATGTRLTQGLAGRSWAPMVEVVAARELEDGAATQWDVVPQLQVSLSRRQHMLLDLGVRVPLDDEGDRAPQVLLYLLWDWYDGGLLEGW